MNESDVVLLQRLASQYVEVERLLQRHEGFEEQLSRLERHKWLSASEQREMKRLKQLKLAGRDRMQQILATVPRSA
ncbi:MAG: YdcH family protein [Deltaproteobacteria bacterium]|nr:YdcH family protein [Deltaproteobacteria bacterium]